MKKNFFPKQTEYRALKPFIDITSIRRNYLFNVFDISNRKNHIAAQPIGAELKFYEAGASKMLDYTSFVSALTKKLVSISSDGRQMLDSK